MLDRRQALRTLAAAAAAPLAAAGPNGRIQLGIIGIGGRGRDHIAAFAERFPSDEQANPYLTRQYRPPFVVPEVRG